jgi:aspartyl-tRNA(Asn)/glutamyl-tRNA(Gln) amidotransferase subunit A
MTKPSGTRIGDELRLTARRLELPLTEDELVKLEGFVENLWHMGGVAPGVEDELRRESSPAGRDLEAVSEPPAAEPVREPVHEWSVRETAAAIADGRLTPAQLVETTLARIRRLDPDVRSYITVAENGSRRAARELSAEIPAGRYRGPLHGIPVGIKDSVPVAGMRWTRNSRIFAADVPAEDAAIAARLRHAGAVIIGKHNLNEFGWSLPTEEDFTPPPRLPWYPEERAVGSSSGGGAATSARLCYAAIGTDGGGSTRLPAGQNGLFGLKPTHERIPRSGYSEGTLSEIGVLAREAWDAAAVFAAGITDPAEFPEPAALAARIAELAEGVMAAPARLRVGLLADYVAARDCEPDVLAALERTLRACAELGVEVLRLDARAIPHLAEAVPITFTMLCAEAFARNRHLLLQHGREIAGSGRLYMAQGAYVSAADYQSTQRVRKLIRDEVDRALDQVDMLLTPTAPVIKTSTARNPETHRRGGNAVFTAPFNLTGHPGLSFPAGVSGEGIPIGMQLVGRYDREFELLKAARAITGAIPRPDWPEL